MLRHFTGGEEIKLGGAERTGSVDKVGKLPQCMKKKFIKTMKDSMDLRWRTSKHKIQMNCCIAEAVTESYRLELMLWQNDEF